MDICVLAIVNNAAVHVGVQISAPVPALTSFVLECLPVCSSSPFGAGRLLSAVVSAPFTLHLKKLQCRWRSDCRVQTSLEAEPGLGPPHSAKYVPSCQPASHSGPSLRPARYDVDQIFCPLNSLGLPTHRAASPALCPASLWKLASFFHRQRTVTLRTLLPT